jgi:2-iminobutanoate/2-iminopropanoate deaminase
MTPERINYPALGLPVGPYSHAVIHGNLLYTSGMTAFGSDAQYESIDRQAEEIFRQLTYICAQQGTDLRNLIKVTLFVSDLSDMEALRQALSQIYREHIPASSLIQVGSLFANELKIEVEAIVGL